MRIGLTSSHFLHQKHFDIINKRNAELFNSAFLIIKCMCCSNKQRQIKES